MTSGNNNESQVAKKVMKYSPKLISLDWNSFKRIRVDCFFRMASLHLGYLPPLDDSKGTTTLSQCIFSLRFNLAFSRVARSSFLANNSMFRGSGNANFYLFCLHFLLTQAHSREKASEKAHLPSLIVPTPPLCIQFHHALLVVIKSSVVILY